MLHYLETGGRSSRMFFLLYSKTTGWIMPVREGVTSRKQFQRIVITVRLLNSISSCVRLATGACCCQNEACGN